MMQSSKQTIRSRPSEIRRSRYGFTLVEMLVAVALVMLMMVLFAQIFQIATSSMSKQRSIAELDQRARFLETVIRGDLERRTRQFVAAFAAGDVVNVVAADTNTSPADWEGYFYISENDPDSDQDDVIQFTVRVNLSAGDDPYFGKATLLKPTGMIDPDIDTQMEREDYLQANANQPEFDDGNPQIDGTGSSAAAEVSYFLRNGNLYRRVLLIRDAYDKPSLASATPSEIDDGAGRYLATNVPPIPDFNGIDWHEANGNFWNDFDYSAYYVGSVGVQFHGTVGPENSLNNDPAGAFPLGHPFNRFGHNHVDGNPRELLDATASSGNSNFFGRFTHEETSAASFGYPGRIPDLDGAGPLDVPTDRATSIDMLGGTVRYNDGAQFVKFSGPRRGEDILLSDVLGFDVKIWDDAINQFVDIGHSITVSGVNGDFHQANNQHSTPATPPIINYGPSAMSNENRIFDTWHPRLDINDADGDNARPELQAIDWDEPPFRPTITVGGVTVPKRLRAVQITIRYRDITSGQTRQVTILSSLVP